MLLEGEARGYSRVKEVGCRKTTSRPWKRLPRATCAEGEGTGQCGVLTRHVLLLLLYVTWVNLTSARAPTHSKRLHAQSVCGALEPLYGLRAGTAALSREVSDNGDHLFFFFPHRARLCRILVSQPGVEPGPQEGKC